MNNERTIVLENVSSQSIGLKDTQNRRYSLPIGAKIRISEASLQDILDLPASRIIFREGLAKVSNVSSTALYNMGLTEDEIKKFSLDDYEAAVVITSNIEEPAEEKIVKVTKPAAKKTTTTTKKTTSTTKKSTTSKSKK